MQTFLPYPDFAASAKTLDMKRLGKQRVETLQILKTVTGRSVGWQNHPATKMWKGYAPALLSYGLAVCDEWLSRGYKDTCREKMCALLAPDKDITLPPWVGDPAVHASHRSNLLRKDPAWYGKWGWLEGPDLPYVWPI